MNKNKYIDSYDAHTDQGCMGYTNYNGIKTASSDYVMHASIEARLVNSL